MPQAHVAASGSTWCPPGSLGSFSPKLLASHSTAGYSSPGAGLGISPCSGRSCQPTSPDCRGLSEWQHDPLACQIFFQFCITCQLAERPRCPVIQVISKEAEQRQSHHPPLQHTASNRPSAGPCAADHNPLSLALQPLLNPPHCPLTFISLSARMTWQTASKALLKST